MRHICNSIYHSIYRTQFQLTKHFTEHTTFSALNMGIYITHFEPNLHISNLQQESLSNTFPTLLATSVFTEHISSLTYNTYHYRT